MKGPRELKRMIALTRKRYHKSNGVVPSFALDHIRMIKLERCKKWQRLSRSRRNGISWRHADER